MTAKKTVLKVLSLALVLVFAAFLAACEKDPPPENWTWTAVADSTVWETYYNDGSKRINNIYGVAWSNNRWVAVGGQGKIAYSTDNGVTWTAVADSTGFSYINAIACSSNRFVAVGQSGKIAYSADNGATWTAVTNSTFGTSDIRAVAYGGGRFVAVGSQGKMAYSADNGANWTAVTNNSTIWDYTDSWGDPSPSMAGIEAVAYGNGRFVAVGGHGKMAYSDDNGVTWTAVTNNSTIWDYTGYIIDNEAVKAVTSKASIEAVAYGNGRFVAVGYQGEMAYSADNGVTWTAVSNGTLYGNIAVAYGGGRFVAVGSQGKMAYSADNGENWTAVADSKFPSTNSDGNSFSISAIAYGNGRFVAVGQEGKMAYADW